MIGVLKEAWVDWKTFVKSVDELSQTANEGHETIAKNNVKERIKAEELEKNKDW